MDTKTKRQPVPAGGQPTPAVIDAADATPPAAPTTPPETADATPPAAPTTPPETADEPETSPAETVGDDGELVEARVLVAFDEHDANDIFTAPAAEVERQKLAGNVDPHPDAVAYAKSLVEDA